LKENYLVIETSPSSARIPLRPGGYRNMRRILSHNYYYIANLMALRQWYQHIRRAFIGPDFSEELAHGLNRTLDKGIAERIKQLAKLRDRLADEWAKGGGIEHVFYQQWPQIEERLNALRLYEGSIEFRDQFMAWIEPTAQENGLDYVKAIQSLGAEQAAVGSQWLQSIVDEVNGL
jgi:hypothetical protein